MKKISLIHVKENYKGKVLEITGNPALRNKLMTMGVYKGKEVIKLSHIGLKGPVVIKAGRTILALGHNVAAKVMIEA